MSKMPRPYTIEEMRDMVLNHIRVMAHYWATADLGGPEFRDDIAKSGGGETLYRLEGLAFSILNMLDGSSVGMPAFDLIPSTHPDDEKFHRDQGENWWPSGVVINECQLHERWHKR